MAVYMLQSVNGGPIKIGCSTAPRQRLSDLRRANRDQEGLRIIRLLEGGRAEEAALHERFSAFGIPGRREWFHPTPEMLGELEYIDLPLDAPGGGASEAVIFTRMTARMKAQVRELGRKEGRSLSGMLRTLLLEGAEARARLPTMI